MRNMAVGFVLLCVPVPSRLGALFLYVTASVYYVSLLQTWRVKQSFLPAFFLIYFCCLPFDYVKSNGGCGARVDTITGLISGRGNFLTVCLLLLLFLTQAGHGGGSCPGHASDVNSAGHFLISGYILIKHNACIRGDSNAALLYFKGGPRPPKGAASKASQIKYRFASPKVLDRSHKCE